MLNANDWQAAADVTNVLLAILVIGGAAVMWRLRGSFVTREEHNAMNGRIDAVEADLSEIKGQMFTTRDAKELRDKMDALSERTGTLLGALPEVTRSMTALTNQVAMLNQHALSQAGK